MFFTGFPVAMVTDYVNTIVTTYLAILHLSNDTILLSLSVNEGFKNPLKRQGLQAIENIGSHLKLVFIYIVFEYFAFYYICYNSFYTLLIEFMRICSLILCNLRNVSFKLLLRKWSRTLSRGMIVLFVNSRKRTPKAKNSISLNHMLSNELHTAAWYDDFKVPYLFILT